MGRRLAVADQAGWEAVEEAGEQAAAAEARRVGEALEDVGLHGEADGQAGPLDVFGGAAAPVDFKEVASVAFEVDAEVGSRGLVIATGHLVEHIAFGLGQRDRRSYFSL